MSPSEIRSRREASLLTQAELGALVGVAERTVRSWEAGCRRPSAYHVRVMQMVFGMRAADELCPMRPTGCGCRCHGRLPRSEMTVLDRRGRTA